MKNMRIFFVLALSVLICLTMAASVLSADEVFHVEKDTIVKEDLVLIGGHSCLLEGTVRGDAVIIGGGNLELYGNVEGDAVVLGGKAHLYEGSHIKGDAVVISGKLTREDGSIVDGNVVTVNVGPLRYLFKLIPSVTEYSTEQGEVKIEKEDKIESIKSEIKHAYKERMKPESSSWILLIWGLALSIVIMIFTVIFPSGSETMTLYLETKPGRSFFAGFLAQILFVPAIFVLVVSIVGILFIPFLIFAYPIALLIALVPPSLFMGKRITRESTSFHGKNSFQSFVGLFVLFVLFFVGNLIQIGSSVLDIIGEALSFLTLFIFYLYFTFGLGSLILSRCGTRKP